MDESLFGGAKILKKLKSLTTLSLLIIGTTLFACGDSDDPYNSTRTIDDNGEPGSWSGPPKPGVGGGGGGSSTGDAGIDNKLLLKDLSPQQTEALCDANYEKYKDHDDPGMAAGLGACLDFAARRGNLLGFEYPEQLMICEEEFIDCYTFPPQTAPEICINQQAQRTCVATVKEFESCGTEDAKILTAYFLRLADQTCSIYASDKGIEELDALLTSFHQPPACAGLLTKCPNIFD